ncbi:MAG: hypothetical protein GY714_19975 [Desulfobacterales bacterium]|nr:hypothetical protein [Desulfobacterales bacterium]
MIRKPLKAPNASLEDSELELLSYPVLGSAKIDGFRCLIDGYAKTSSMKPQPNPFIQNELSFPWLNGLDGELVIGKPNDPGAFNKSTGPLRRQHGEPDFTFYVFDRFLKPNESYGKRWILELQNFPYHSRVIALPQEVLKSPAQVIAFTKACINQGFEGAMIRTIDGKYKQGRATFNEMNIFKRKPLSDAEATIIGFNEKMTNLNPQEIDEMGYAKRASNQENKVPAGTLGSFILQSALWEKPFNCRGKIDDPLALEIWNNKEKYLGKQVTFKYQAYGSIDAPRQPIFHRFYEEF